MCKSPLDKEKKGKEIVMTNKLKLINNEKSILIPKPLKASTCDEDFCHIVSGDLANCYIYSMDICGSYDEAGCTNHSQDVCEIKDYYACSSAHVDLCSSSDTTTCHEAVKYDISD